MYRCALALPSARKDKALLSSYGALLCRPTIQRYGEAIAAFEAALALDPAFAVASKNLAWAERALQALDEN
eukprot:SAG11_NODE_2327_length_3516_cov_2.408838_2_plen_71_part_00